MARHPTAMCLTKTRYATRADAQRALRWTRGQGASAALGVYCCHLCLAYHLGHARRRGASKARARGDLEC
jgi:hypothetical protein